MSGRVPRDSGRSLWNNRIEVTHVPELQTIMAHCDQGYLCDVCGEEVEDITGSDLYLRYVTGEVDGRSLLATPERHIRCNPTTAQFIVDPEFPPVHVEGVFSKSELDPQFVRDRETLLTRGWRRLQELAHDRPALPDYPLEEFRKRLKTED